MKNLYPENYKIVMKEFENDTKNGKISCVLGMEALILLKCPGYPKQSTDLLQSQSKYPWHFSQNYNKLS